MAPVGTTKTGQEQGALAGPGGTREPLLGEQASRPTSMGEQLGGTSRGRCSSAGPEVLDLQAPETSAKSGTNYQHRLSLGNNHMGTEEEEEEMRKNSKKKKKNKQLYR